MFAYFVDRFQLIKYQLYCYVVGFWNLIYAYFRNDVHDFRFDVY